MRLVPVTCPKCGAEVDLAPKDELVKCTYCGTTSFIEKAEPEAVAFDDAAWAREQAARERRDEAERAEGERAQSARLAELRRQDEASLRLAIEEDRVRERNRKILIWVLAALPVSAFLALYLTK